MTCGGKYRTIRPDACSHRHLVDRWELQQQCRNGAVSFRRFHLSNEEEFEPFPYELLKEISNWTIDHILLVEIFIHLFVFLA